MAIDTPAQASVRCCDGRMGAAAAIRRQPRIRCCFGKQQASPRTPDTRPLGRAAGMARRSSEATPRIGTRSPARRPRGQRHGLRLSLPLRSWSSSEAGTRSAVSAAPARRGKAGAGALGAGDGGSGLPAACARRSAAVRGGSERRSRARVSAPVTRHPPLAGIAVRPQVSSYGRNANGLLVSQACQRRRPLRRAARTLIPERHRPLVPLGCSRHAKAEAIDLGLDLSGRPRLPRSCPAWRIRQVTVCTGTS
jgi:hypothetical protein